MTAVTHNRFLLPAWAVSLTLHGVVVTLATLFAAQVRPVFQEEPFMWDVALVEAAKTDSPTEPAAQAAADPTPPVVRPVQPQVRPTPSRVEPPPPDTVMHRVAPQQTMQMVHPEAQPQKAIEQRQEPPLTPHIEAPAPVVKPIQERPIEPAEQQIVESPKPKSESVTKESEPLQTAETMMQQPVASAPSEPTVGRSVEAPATPSVSEPAAASSPSEPAPPIASPASPPAHEAPMQTAKAAPGPASQEAPIQTAKAGAPGPEVKTDHRWLAESLWRRVAELKRYPSSARLNGQEGKVVLKAVIRSDGHLIEVTVQKSSGHQILDAAAVEAVKLACPLHMKHSINKPEIVVSLPIVYTLAN